MSGQETLAELAFNRGAAKSAYDSPVGGLKGVGVTTCAEAAPSPVARIESEAARIEERVRVVATRIDGLLDRIRGVAPCSNVAGVAESPANGFINCMDDHQGGSLRVLGYIHEQLTELEQLF